MPAAYNWPPGENYEYTMYLYFFLNVKILCSLYTLQVTIKQVYHCFHTSTV